MTKYEQDTFQDRDENDPPIHDVVLGDLIVTRFVKPSTNEASWTVKNIVGKSPDRIFTADPADSSQPQHAKPNVEHVFEEIKVIRTHSPEPSEKQS